MPELPTSLSPVLISSHYFIQVLAEDIPNIITKISFPKSMRWNSQVNVHPSFPLLMDPDTFASLSYTYHSLDNPGFSYVKRIVLFDYI